MIYVKLYFMPIIYLNITINNYILYISNDNTPVIENLYHYIYISFSLHY